MDDQTPVVYTDDKELENHQGCFRHTKNEFQIARSSLFLEYAEQLNLATILAIGAVLYKSRLVSNDDITFLLIAIQEQAHALLADMECHKALITAQPDTTRLQ